MNDFSPRSNISSENTYQIKTFGCKVNQYDSQQIHESIQKLGFRQAEGPEVPEWTIISACTVTSKGLAKSREIARRRKRDFPDTKLVVTGCISDEEQETMSKMPEIDLIVPHLEKFDILAKMFKNDSLKIDPFSAVNGLGGRTRAFLKVQDGCDQYCTYCRIPYVRSKLWSKPVSKIVEEAKQLEDQGFKEIVLTGIHIGHYYRTSEDGSTLNDVLVALLRETSLPRIRVSSIEVLEVNEELISLAAENKRVCPHFHIPLQSGSNEILKLMGRAYSIEEYLERVNLVKSAIDRPSLSADVIVGFPHESDEDFQKTIDVIREVGYSSMHIFPYSTRPNTGAWNLKKQVHGNIKSERVELLINLGDELRNEFDLKFLNEDVDVLIESNSQGTTDRYVKVKVENSNELEGQLISVKTTSQVNGVLTGRISSSKLSFQSI
ncbi:MAG: tRNA (N(6)-L-threonylcarbamoyladenosine(37)-C(2))-methylthiotransferase MtaB [Planctomycetota bacterium]|nr:MAG: tRNA (N(6)-L-threonylcarbamoyladenosine(37)-C(2))-methylthiotransferase MtaB [Planctomycetota bacterium]